MAVELLNKHQTAPYELIFDGVQCPTELTHILTPMEFEELVTLFYMYDTSRTGFVTREDFKRICVDLDFESFPGKIDGLMADIDIDKEEFIAIDELCRFSVMVKTSMEGKLRVLTEKLAKERTTPFVELHHQAAARDLKVKFIALEIRETSIMGLPVHVTELHISGLWESVSTSTEENTGVIKTYEVRKFQGIGHTFRDAKYSAAAAGLITLTMAILPGAKCKAGEIPSTWLQWVHDNMLQGVDPLQVLTVLKSKGFQPHLNTPLLHKIIAWHHFDQFLLKNPEFHENLTGPPEEKDRWDGVSGEGSEIVLDAYFRQWVKKVLERGLDGSIFLEMLEDRGLPVVSSHSHFAQQILNKELCNVASSFLDFHVACEEGFIEVVRVFCESGVDIEEAAVGRRTKESFRPLAMAAMEDHIGVVRVLLEYKAEVRQLDNRGRSALHSAASKGHTAVCELLLEHKAELFAPDFHGNNPIHLSVIGNHILTLNFLAQQGLEFYRAVSADAVLVQVGGSFSKLVDEIYYQLQDQLLYQSETRRFEKAWLDQAAVLFLAAMDPDVRPLLAVPGCNPQIFSDVLSRFDPRPETGVFKNVKSKRAGKYSTKLFVPTIDTSRDLCVLLKECFRQAVLDSVNNMKRTCFHLACDLNQITSHEEIIASLVNVFGVNVRLLDRHGKRGIDLLVVNKPPGHGLIPSASALREEVLIEDREKFLMKVSQDMKDIENLSDAQRKFDLLEDCCNKSQAMNSKMWEACRAASMPWVAAGSTSKDSKIGTYTYIYIHVCMYIYIYTYIHVYIYT
jgi:ankyrin repeat protein